MSVFNKMYFILKIVLIIFVIDAMIVTTEMKRFTNYEGGEHHEEGEEGRHGCKCRNDTQIGRASCREIV